MSDNIMFVHRPSIFALPTLSASVHPKSLFRKPVTGKIELSILSCETSSDRVRTSCQGTDMQGMRYGDIRTDYCGLTRG
jgi:hypothetical protein